MGSILGSRSEVQYGDDLRDWINHHPEPEDVRPAPQPCTHFVRLEVGQVEIVEPVVMHQRIMFTCACQPHRDGAMPMAEDTDCSGCIESFGQGRQYLAHTVG